MMNQTSSDVEERRENIAGAANVGPEGITPPDRKRFQREMDEIAERIRDLEATLKFLEKQILSHSGANSKANVHVDREKLLRERHELRAQREKIIEERKKIDLDLKGLNDQVQRKDDACAKLKAGLRYKTEAGYDDAVKRLERQLQVQQLRLQEEKRLVAEINKLTRSKRNLSEYWTLKEEVDQLRNNQTKLRARRDGCVKQLSRVKSREEVVKNLLESSDNSTVGEEESKQAELMKKKEDIKQELTELRTKKKNLSDNFSMEKRKYKEEVKEMKAQKQQKEVLTRRKNERFVTQKEM
ncbi:PREDICTED: trichohyalin-like [Acropora digitifera]|uniref:trichohyalin-like n=1 Tax=Acropora digitifera TaxID=70779 RepID=UPI00077B1ACA|nr:PREDICTED: trichohyalin-like [Acropora digitifera]